MWQSKLRDHLLCGRSKFLKENGEIRICRMLNEKTCDAAPSDCLYFQLENHFLAFSFPYYSLAIGSILTDSKRYVSVLPQKSILKCATEVQKGSIYNFYYLAVE